MDSYMFVWAGFELLGCLLPDACLGVHDICKQLFAWACCVGCFIVV